MTNSIKLKVHPMFFMEFASKTWTSISRVVSELVENSFDEDATKVLITMSDDGSIIVEDDAGMDKTTLAKFLLVGSPHKKDEHLSPKFKRLRSGRYGTGKLGFLTAFNRMFMKTKNKSFSQAFELNESLLGKLAAGEAKLKSLKKSPLKRDGTEIKLFEPKVKGDPRRLIRELKRLACLKQPFFEIFFKQTPNWSEWSFKGAEQILPPHVEGLHIPLSEPGLEGEIIVSKQPIPEEERGLAIMVGGHTVARNSFGITGVSADRITGWVRGEGLTARFADKSALVEDNIYDEFSKKIRIFLKEKVIPLMKDYIEVEITREESRVYRQVDRLLSDAVHSIIESVKDGEEISTDKQVETIATISEEGQSVFNNRATLQPIIDKNTIHKNLSMVPNPIFNSSSDKDSPGVDQNIPEENISKRSKEFVNWESSNINKSQTIKQYTDTGIYFPPMTSSQLVSTSTTFSKTDSKKEHPSTPRVRKIKKTFILNRVGYRIIPYEDEYDEKEAFAEEAMIYVNKAHPAYHAEAQKGGELLLRHVVRLVSKVIALSHHPEGREALELQNKLIAEAIKLRQKNQSRKKSVSAL